jgi:Protein of unknown function (DUF1553)/Protein of unknown function (DUF1549)/Planctomycete cytochrome C
MKLISHCAAFAACCVAICASPLLAGQPTELTFERDIRPILREYCFDCHGAHSEKEGKLDLRLVRFIHQGGESGAALAKSADESLLYKRISSGEMPPGEGKVPSQKLEVIRQWIEAGAKTERVEPTEIGPGVPITPEDRQYWAFRKITRPAIPSIWPSLTQRVTTSSDVSSGANVVGTTQVRTPIDALLVEAMPNGIAFSPDADRETLIRRLYFDLLGLPPTVQEFDRWRSMGDANWYEQLVDHLLDSPHYGERWARHWLDVAGYADSEGQTIQDADRAWAWKYRDYVIASFNANKPFDRFIIEQLAGDELAGPKQGDWTAAQIELLTATGFLTMAADGTGSGDNSPEARNKVIADTIKIVSSSLLGVSIGCAQCHDHRYDPISQLDYYGMRAVFEPAFDWENWRVPDARRVSLYTVADHDKAAAIEQEAKVVIDDRNAKQAIYMAQALDKELTKYEDPLKSELRTAYQTAEKDRTEEQKQLLKKYPSVNISPGVLYQYLPEADKELKALDSKVAEIRAKKPQEQFIRAMTEVPDRVPETKLFHRGDHQRPKEKVLPSDLTIAAPEGELPKLPERDTSLPTTGRRLAYAQWLTSGQHPLVARVLVNRVWLHHFGQAIVATPSEFGKLGTEPTHPALLDWLADEFVRTGWDLKKLHRLILNSSAWRQSSTRDEAMASVDAENKYYWRKAIQRLDAEVLRDRMLVAAGNLDARLFGPPVGIKEDDAGQVIVDGAQRRRSLYIKVRRTQPVAMLQSFDAPVMEVNCERRPVSTVATQSLILMNGEFTLQQAEGVAARAIRESPVTIPAQLIGLPELPKPVQSEWRYGYGRFDDQTQRVNDFIDLPHWNGSEWQGGTERPDPKIGWVIVNTNGGHPGSHFAAIRRWTAHSQCKIKIDGTIQHGSESGDGVRGRVVSSHRGLLGQWESHHNAVQSNVDVGAVQAGETIDLIVDCKANENADSFTWNAKIHITDPTGETAVRDSAADFHGPSPADSYQNLPSQLQYAWQLILSRPPTQAEMQLAMQFAANQLRSLQRDTNGIAAGSSASKQVLVNFSHSLLNSNEFVYVD